MKSALKYDTESRRGKIINLAFMVSKRNLEAAEASLDITERKPQVICLIESNSVGKITIVVKLAHFYHNFW
jgi:signal recognition particle GTPase